MKRLFATLFVSILLAGCQSNTGITSKGYRSIRTPLVIANQSGIAFKNPNQTSWLASTSYGLNNIYTQVFDCRDAACAPPSRVLYRNLSYNKAQTYDCNCSEDITKAVLESTARTGKKLIDKPQRGKYKSYDTIYYYWTRTQDNRTVEGYDLWILFGKREFILEGRAPHRASSQKAVEHFLSMVEIDDGDTSD